MNQTCKKELPESHEYLTCPFCLKQCIHAEPGKTCCPVCDAIFEINERVECVFTDTDNIRLPVNGVVCGSCGLIQNFAPLQSTNSRKAKWF